MIEFIAGPHNEKITLNEKFFIVNMLRTCYTMHSRSFCLNMKFNNFAHFTVPTCPSNIAQFLLELSLLAHSENVTVQVMGGVHTDSYGHISGLIGRYNEFNEFVPCIVRDKYIRFRIVPKEMKALQGTCSMSPASVYHFLVDDPVVVR